MFVHNHPWGANARFVAGKLRFGRVLPDRFPMGPLASRESSDARAQRKRSTTSGRPTANTALPAPVAANSANRPGTTSATRSGTDYRPGKSLTRYLPQVAVATSACLGDADHRGLAAALGGRDRA